MVCHSDRVKLWCCFNGLLINRFPSDLYFADNNLLDTRTEPPDIVDLNELLRAGITDYEYVRPTKVHTQSLHTDDLLYESKNRDAGFSNSENHNITGQFRNKTSRIWDPHPQYEMDAFGQHILLILYHDGSFIHDDLKVSCCYSATSNWVLSNDCPLLNCVLFKRRLVINR